MKNKKRSIPAPVIEIAIVVVLALLIWIFVDASIESVLQDEAGSCISVIFDKPAVRGADRILVYEGSQVITITDKETVKQIAGMFTVANRTCLCDAEFDRRIEIYNGDRLVRNVVANCDGSLYEIYDTDLLHWVIGFETTKGQLQLSHEEYQWLNDIIAQYK